MSKTHKKLKTWQRLHARESRHSLAPNGPIALAPNAKEPTLVPRRRRAVEGSDSVEGNPFDEPTVEMMVPIYTVRLNKRTPH